MNDDCPVEGCLGKRSSSHMMCRSCWRRVSPGTQSLVYKCWRAYSRAATSGAAGRRRR